MTKANLSTLIEAALNGEEVIIARDGRPAVRLVPVSKTFAFDILAERVGCAVPDFLEPMSEEDLLLWEGCGDDRF